MIAARILLGLILVAAYLAGAAIVSGGGYLGDDPRYWRDDTPRGRGRDHE